MNVLLAIAILLGATCGYSFASEAHEKKMYSSYIRGLVLAEEGEYRKSLKELETAKRLDPKSVYIRLKISSLLMRLGDFARAEKELKSAKKIDTSSPDVSLALIFLYSYTQQDSLIDAEYGEFLKKSYTKAPQDVKVCRYLAQFHIYKKEYKKGIALYEALLKSNPIDGESAFWLGYAYDETGRRPDAVEVWRKGLQVDSQNAVLLNSLGYAYAEENTNLDEAETMIRRALEKEPENGAYLDSLGWVYFRKGNNQQALEYIQKAAALLKDPVIYSHLGDIYCAMQLCAEAREALAEGLEYFPRDAKLLLRREAYGKKDSECKAPGK